MTPSIPIVDLRPDIERHQAASQEAFARVLRSGLFIGGPEVEAFEREVADFLGVEHAVGLNSGTDALVISLRSLGVGVGDEVITTPFTFFATAEAISSVGATPVFVDVDDQTFNLTAEGVEAAITERTAAVLPVHLYGRPAPMRSIGEVARRHGLAVIEDAAQAFGATTGEGRVGALGDAAAFSFFPSKTLGAYGDAGLLATSTSEVAAQARMLRAHGGRRKYHNEVLGYNSRLDALQAALLRVRLPYVGEAMAGRQAAAARYSAALAGVEGLLCPETPPGHGVHQYTVRVLGGRRDAVRQHLQGVGIQAMVYYPVPLHRLPVYADLPLRQPLPVADRLAGEVLSLPLWPTIGVEVQDRVVEAVVDGLQAFQAPPALHS